MFWHPKLRVIAIEKNAKQISSKLDKWKTHFDQVKKYLLNVTIHLTHLIHFYQLYHVFLKYYILLE